MADPFSIAASVIGVASAGVKLSSTLIRYTETVINADKSIHEIARDLSITSSVITQLGTLLAQDGGRDPYSGAVLGTARDAVARCNEVFGEMQRLLDRTISSKKTTIFRLRMLTWPITETRLGMLHTQLERHKNTLILVLNVVSYAESSYSRESMLLATIAQTSAAQRSWAAGVSPAVPQSPEYETPIPVAVENWPGSAPVLATSVRTGFDHVWESTGTASGAGLRSTTSESVIVSKSTSVDIKCPCDSLRDIYGTDTFHISREHLGECAVQLRTLLKAVEDAQTVKNGDLQCEVLKSTYRESMDVLETMFAAQKKQPSKRRWLSLRH